MNSCKCVFLDGREVNIRVKRDATAGDLFNSVCKYLNVADRRPYGLVHRGGTKPSMYNWWLKLDKLLRKQVPGKCQIWAFSLMIKYYPIARNISTTEDITRFFAVLQVRQDLLTGRLTCPTHTLALLASYWLQSEYGDFANENIDRQLVKEFEYIRKGDHGKRKGRSTEESDIDLEEQMIELHRCLRGFSRTQADLKFLHLASSLEMYGVHFYPAYKPHPEKRTVGKGMMMGIGPKGVVTMKEKKRPKIIEWSAIRAFAFEQNSVTVKRNEPSKDEKKARPKTFLFEDVGQAKYVWRTAVDLHVRYRVESSDSHKPGFHVKMARHVPSIGKRHAKLKATSPGVRRPQLTVITEASPAATQRKSGAKSSKNVKKASQTKRKHQGDSPRVETRLMRSGASEKNETQPKIPISPARSRSSRKATSINPTPKSSPSVRRADLSQAAATTTDPKVADNETVTTLRFDDKVASAVPPRVRSSMVSSKASSTDGSSVITDNTDVLCGSSVIEKAFSYAEKDGPNSIKAWLELCTPREDERRGRPAIRSAPGSRRSPSRGRSPLEEDVLDIDDYKPLIRSKRPVVIRAKELRDLSPPLTVHYEDEPYRRMPTRYKSENNISRKNWYSPPRSEIPSTDRTSPERRYADIYRREYFQNLADNPSDTYRRSKSMHSLRTNVRDRSMSRESRCSPSPSSVSAVASSGSRRSRDSYLAGHYDDDYFDRIVAPPFETSFARRVFSETRLNRTTMDHGDYRYNQPRSVLRNRDQSERDRRSNVTSWAYGDDMKASSERAYSPARRSKETIPSIPKFVRSVR